MRRSGTSSRRLTAGRSTILDRRGYPGRLCQESRKRTTAYSIRFDFAKLCRAHRMRTLAEAMLVPPFEKGKSWSK